MKIGDGWHKSYLIFLFWKILLQWAGKYFLMYQTFLLEYSGSFLCAVWQTYLFLIGFQTITFYHYMLLWYIFRVSGLFCCWLRGYETSKLVKKHWSVIKKEFINMCFLAMFIYGVIQDKALTLRLALLIIPFRCSVNLSCESIFIPCNFWQSLFSISVFLTLVVSLSLPLAKKWY